MAPLIVLAVAIAALMFGHSDAQTQLLTQVELLIGSRGAEAVRDMLEHAQKPGSGIVATITSIVTLLIGASGVFNELRAALNDIWDVPADADAGIWELVRDHVLSFGMVIGVGFLLLVSLIVSATLAALGKFFGDYLPLPESALSVINFFVSFVGIALLFGLIFRFVPARRIPARELRTGAVITALLFTIGKSLIGLYLGKAAVGSAYGAAGSFVIITVWIYYSSMIFLFGAKLTQVLYSDEYRSRLNELRPPGLHHLPEPQ